MSPSLRRLQVSIGLIVVAFGLVIAVASRRNSLTFDEPFMISAGVRSVATGDISMAFDQPPGMLYFYGAAVKLASAVVSAGGGHGINLPSESGTADLSPEVLSEMPAFLKLAEPYPRWGLYNRYDYARAFFFEVGNNPQPITLIARIANVLLAMALALTVAAFAWRREGPIAAVIGVSIFCCLPDVMAHGAIAYNDIAVTLTFLLSLWAIDSFVRDPGPRHGALAGLTIGLALSIKFSALSLGPIAVALACIEAFARRGDRQWMTRLAKYGVVALAAAFAVLILVYHGDVTLSQFREGVQSQLIHSNEGHGVPALLLDRKSDAGFWYFFPVALVLKTPIALHILAVLSVVGFVAASGDRATGPDWTVSPLRPLIVGGIVYLIVLMRSNLDIGVRYALPLMPLITILIAVGLARLWARKRSATRAAIGVLIGANAVLTLSFYPWFLSYVTELVPKRERLTALADSSCDWGQGLLALKDFMTEREITGVYLAYFGSALPEGYGIRYSALPSWRPLPQTADQGAPFQWVIVSATLLNGLYEQGDPFAALRARQPDAILANTLYAYRIR